LTAPVRVCHSCEVAIEKQHQQNVKSRQLSTSSAPGSKQHNVYSNSPSSLIFSSTPPFGDIVHSSGGGGSASSSGNNNNNSSGSSKVKLLNPIYSGGNENVSSPGRCNQNIDLTKFKKNESSSAHKVPVQ
jgi:hypothetical protein